MSGGSLRLRIIKDAINTIYHQRRRNLRNSKFLFSHDSADGGINRVRRLTEIKKTKRMLRKYFFK